MSIRERAETALDAILGRSVGVAFDAIVLALGAALLTWLSPKLWLIASSPKVPIQISVLSASGILLSLLLLAGTTMGLLLILRRKTRLLLEAGSHRCPKPTVLIPIEDDSSKYPSEIGIEKVEHPARVNWEVKIIATRVPARVKHATIINKGYPVCDCGGATEWHERANGYREGDKAIFCGVCGKRILRIHSDKINPLRGVVENMAVAQFRRNNSEYKDER